MGDNGTTTCNLTNDEITDEASDLDLRVAEGEIGGRYLFLASPVRRRYWCEPCPGRRQ
jgi:hypothetical protein